MFAFVILLAASSPVFAPPPSVDIVVKPQTTDVTVGDFFDVDIWIENMADAIVGFQFIVTWDESLVMMDSDHIHYPANWQHQVNVGETNTGLGFYALQMNELAGGAQLEIPACLSQHLRSNA